MNAIKKIVYFCFLFFFISEISALSPVKKDGKFVCQYKDNKREYIIFLPDGIENFTSQQKSQISLILMLHGAGGSAEGFSYELTDFIAAANSEGYALVFPNGTKTKNTPTLPVGWHYFNDQESKEDAEFLIELCKYLQKEYSLGKKTFVAGFSNGGFMVNKLACQYSKYFTAAASVAGMMPKPVWEKKAKKIKTGFLQINGTKDDVVPMKLNGSSKYSPNPAMEDVIEYFRTANAVKKPEWVKWIIIEDGHHSWPTEKTSTIDASKEVLEFFNGF